MKLDVKKHLTSIIEGMDELENRDKILVPDATLETEDIKIVMISEVFEFCPRTS